MNQSAFLRIPTVHKSQNGEGTTHLSLLVGQWPFNLFQGQTNRATSEAHEMRGGSALRFSTCGEEKRWMRAVTDHD